MVTKLYNTKHPTRMKVKIVTQTAPILFSIMSANERDPIKLYYKLYNIFIILFLFKKRRYLSIFYEFLSRVLKRLQLLLHK